MITDLPRPLRIEAATEDENGYVVWDEVLVSVVVYDDGACELSGMQFDNTELLFRAGIAMITAARYADQCREESRDKTS